MDDPATALQAVENSLRLVIRDVLGDSWRSSISDLPRLEGKRAEDRARRDGAIVSDDLLSYVEFYHLSKIVRDNWDPHFAPIFSDKKRTDVLFGILGDVRNAIAHSRELLRFERELVSGASGQLRNQVTIFRTQKAPATSYYPIIESVIDNFGQIGRQGITDLESAVPVPLRLEVGDTVSFACRGSDERGRELEWFLQTGFERSLQVRPSASKMCRGSSTTIEWQPTESHVGESQFVYVGMRAADGRFRRNKGIAIAWEEDYDDMRIFRYAINPPHL